MRRLFVLAALAGLIVPVAQAHTRNVSIRVEDDGQVTSCDQVVVRFDEGAGYRAEEELPVAKLNSLRLHAAHNGGVYVTGSGNTYAVRACKAAASEGLLRDLRVNVSGDEVTAEGPGSGNWLVYFLVSVPRNATLELDSQNGPISLRDVTGTVTARATNGPISVKNSSGTLDLETQNGPISLSGGSGTVKMNAQNGPITVKLDRPTWDGSLDARTQNGPLSLKVPRDFRSGLLVESDGHGPMTCHLDMCRDARRPFNDDEDAPRRIEVGSGPTVVHMTTVNGPVSVRDND